MTARYQAETQARRSERMILKGPILLLFILISTAVTAKPPETLEELRDMALAELSSVDVIRMNLIVAKEIDPEIDIPAFERLVDVMAAYVKQQIDLNESFFQSEKAEYGGSREKWMVTLMWSVFTNDFGLHYIEGGNEALDHTKAWQKFVHGPLVGKDSTCCTLPILYIAVGRRLGFPIRGVAAPLHLYCRWEGDGGVQFNIETTSSKGMVFPTDKDILSWKSNACPDSWKTHLFQPMNARQLLGHFLSLRADCYGSRKLYRHAVVDLNNALLLYPKNPAMTRNLMACLKLQDADPEYLNDETLRSLRPQRPAWNDLPN